MWGKAPDDDGHHPGLPGRPLILMAITPVLPRNSWFRIGMGAMFLLSALEWREYGVGLVTQRRLTAGTGSHFINTGTHRNAIVSVGYLSCAQEGCRPWSLRTKAPGYQHPV